MEEKYATNDVSEIPYTNTPKLVDSLAKYEITKVSCGLIHTVAFSRDPAVCFSWGNNSHGQLGRQSNSLVNPP